MLSRKIFFIIFTVALNFCCAVPHPESGKRVVDKPLSNQPHYSDNEAHNKEYDHEAFLGEEEARKFEQLSPEESKERLGKIVDKIDKDKDSFVSERELTDWIKYTQMKYVIEDVDRQWSQYNSDQKKDLDWETYKKVTYSFIDEDNEDTDDTDMKTYKEMMQRDKRRWETADADKDNQLSKAEFSHFLHPEEAAHMHDVFITETLEDIDKDNDGKVSLKEYIGDMYSGSEEDEPDWVKNEREQFSMYRDKNNDGVMDREEVKEWLLPSGYNDGEAEAKHLIYESDENKDGKLSKQEIVNSYDLFVGSQATDFGGALNRHDEF